MSLAEGWSLIHAEAGHATPEGFHWADATPATVPITIARTLDDKDVWLRKGGVHGPGELVLPAVGPIADLFIDGKLVSQTRSLHRTHTIALDWGEHELVIALRSPARSLAEKRPRPKWKTRLVDHQQLRWLRTPLLGRIPSWAPNAAPRGLYATPRVTIGQFDPDRVALHAWLDGDRGRVTIDGARGATTLTVGERSTALADGRGELVIEQPPRWWPHTHGAPQRLPASVRVGDHDLALGHVGFRTLTVDDPRRFSLRVNGELVFCRGAVHVPSFERLDPSHDRRALLALRDAGGNMVRIGGTMRYEDHRFFEWCDELGLLVWQDFMFANMDYPIEDAGFAAEIGQEIDEQLGRWARHPSIAVLCGGSEVAQQAAMVGQPPDRWYGPLFERVLPDKCAAILPEIPYVLGSPSAPLDGDGGDVPPPLPFRPDVGVAHYYGVGAYLRPFEDARRADVTFASECLALSNVPEPAAVEAMFGDDQAITHSPRWKAGVPRDNGAGWDFEDVRDHYQQLLFGESTVADRYPDPEGYLERARATSVEVLTRTYAEWRRTGSRTHGGLVWLLRDLAPGAGWGLLDVEGEAKAPLLALRRVWSPTALLLTDEGNNGIRLHVVHKGSRERRLRVHVALYRHDGTLVAEHGRELVAAPRSKRELDVEGLFGAFRDIAWTYRFGPRMHDVLLAHLYDGEQLVGETSHFASLPAHPRDPGLTATVLRQEDGAARVTVRAAQLASFVVVRVPGWRADHGYFHLPPNGARDVILRAESPRPSRGVVQALGGALVTVSVP
jgi:beta-mannosidase